ncbi:MAG: hypothetical protein R3204_06095, partial [Oceanospirillum sp.]|nr:hypothetical protein [Oceanospirillum sp.]
MSTCQNSSDIQLQDLQLTRHYQQLPEQDFQRIAPAPLNNPYLVSVNPDVAQKLGLDPDSLSPKELAAYASGHKLFAGSGGSRVAQHLVMTGAGLEVTAAGADGPVMRSWPGGASPMMAA